MYGRSSGKVNVQQREWKVRTKHNGRTVRQPIHPHWLPALIAASTFLTARGGWVSRSKKSHVWGNSPPGRNGCASDLKKTPEVRSFASHMVHAHDEVPQWKDPLLMKMWRKVYFYFILNGVPLGFKNVVTFKETYNAFFSHFGAILWHLCAKELWWNG